MDHVVVAVFVRYEESSFQWTTVRVLTMLVEYLSIMIVIVVVYRSIERQQYHLGSLFKKCHKLYANSSISHEEFYRNFSYTGFLFFKERISNNIFFDWIKNYCHNEIVIFTSSAKSPPGINVPSREQKQYGSSQLAGSHLSAKSVGVSVMGAGAENEMKE